MSEKEKISQNKFLFYTSVSSIISGMTAKIFVHPFDTVKAKLQAGTIPALSLYFTSYEFSKKFLAKYEFFEKNEALRFFSSGMIAEMISCMFFVPIDIIKERMQVQSNLNLYKYNNTADAIRQILKSEGITGLYRAYGATIMSFGPFSALQMLFYEKLKIFFCKNPRIPSFYESLALSSVSGSLASVLTNPLDMAKLRMQVQRGSKAISNSQETLFGYKNIFHGMYLIVKKEGSLALFKGSLARVLYHFPNVTFIITSLETIRKYFILIFEGKTY